MIELNPYSSRCCLANKKGFEKLSQTTQTECQAELFEALFEPKQ
jgi:hypothetical protein